MQGRLLSSFTALLGKGRGGRLGFTGLVMYMYNSPGIKPVHGNKSQAFGLLATSTADFPLSGKNGREYCWFSLLSDENLTSVHCYRRIFHRRQAACRQFNRCC